MRARQTALILVLVALPVAVALLIGRSQSRAPAAPGATPTLVGLNLKGGQGQLQASSCGVPHHYTAYRASTTIRFGGNVTAPPSGSWKVKVKLKSCLGSRFEDAGQVGIHVRRDDTFKGSFRAPVAGDYFARASVNVRGRRIARSSKQFFRVR